MGEIKKPLPVLLFMAAFGSCEEAFLQGRKKAENRFGPIELESETFRFDRFTDYYAATMGSVLPKRLWAFRHLIDPSELVDVKRTTNIWEDEFKRTFDLEIRGRPGLEQVTRPLNLDPGYVDLGKLVLASTKDHAHRIYLGKGIFGETTLIYTRKRWTGLPWSYPDYCSDEYHAFLCRCRDYLKQAREQY